MLIDEMISLLELAKLELVLQLDILMLGCIPHSADVYKNAIYFLNMAVV